MTAPTPPMLGQLVHYLDDSSEPSCLAALVTEIDGADPGHAGLCVLYPSGTFFKGLGIGGVRHDAEDAPDSWHHVTEHGGSAL